MTDEKLLAYFDEIYLLEQELSCLSSLCRSVQDSNQIDSTTLEQIGFQIQKFLNQKNIIDFYFFERSIEFGPISESRINAEVYDLDEKHGFYAKSTS